jgi:GDPmannose 4,6-dehydratase
MASKRHFISGITGQDGIFLTLEILKNESSPLILGTSRSDKSIFNFISKLKHLDLNINTKDISIKKVNLEDKIETKSIIKNFEPDIVYNLSGPSSVYDSLLNPDQFRNSIENIFYNILAASVDLNSRPTIYQSSSSEMFSSRNSPPFDENSAFESRSPYGDGKLGIYNQLDRFRERNEIKIVNGIMFNHDSEFRSNKFLIPKIVKSAFNIKNNKQKKIFIGSFDIIRDWSYAGDVSSAIYLLSKLGKSEDYVIGSGKGTSIRELVKLIFLKFDLEYEHYVFEDNSLLRKSDPKVVISNPKKINELTGWHAKVKIEEIIEKYINYNLL